MATIRVIVAATTTDALANLQQYATIGPSVVNMWAAGVTKTDTVQLFMGNVALMNPVNPNIEASADVCDNDRDQLLFNEVVNGGKLVLPVTVTTETQVLISIKPL
jgi:hypothetical protein